MNHDTETIEELCAIIRKPDLGNFKTYDEMAERILNAHNREILKYRSEACHDDGRMSAMSLEIVRLKDALKPVLSVNMNMGANYSDLFFAVREAQRKCGNKNC